MPLGIQRINAKRTQPNSRIVFIKPLKGPDEKTAQDFLERIAAQCLPIMREHHLSVTTLEEYEFNREFVGRNFNAGEVIQLVLRSASGRWLPFAYVQMVMMHELAHCVHMNHSRRFWGVRNGYADQMRGLWSRGYTGEGIWGRGALLGTGAFEADGAGLLGRDEMPEHLCGGTYRSRRGRKRKGKQQLSYQERKERRIRRKFGVNGQALGEDEDVKAQLEKGRRTQAKPRVAGSNRGRELRAAAALARFGEQQKEEEKEKKRALPPGREEDENETASDQEDDGSETESGSDNDVEDAIVDVNGRKLVDGKGHRLVRVCADENQGADDDLEGFGEDEARNEMQELLQSSVTRRQGIKMEDDEDDVKFTMTTSSKNPDNARQGHGDTAGGSNNPRHARDSDGSLSKSTTTSHPKATALKSNLTVSRKSFSSSNTAVSTAPKPKAAEGQPRQRPQPITTKSQTDERQEEREKGQRPCPLCSFDSGPGATTCAVCAHVLNPARVPGCWRCEACGSGSGSSSLYLNAGDAALCGVCGQQRK